jgi:hypothetical protein
LLKGGRVAALLREHVTLLAESLDALVGVF